MSGGQDDPVGYRRPPKAHRFGAANSGNRRGRPAGSKNIKTLVQQIAHERQVVQENGRPVTLTNVALVFRTLQQKALSGDVRAIKLLDHYRASLGRAVDEKPQAIFILPERTRGTYLNGAAKPSARGWSTSGPRRRPINERRAERD